MRLTVVNGRVVGTGDDIREKILLHNPNLVVGSARLSRPLFLENVYLYRTPPTLPHIALTLPKAVHTIHCHLHRAVKFQLILPQLSTPPPTTITISQSRPSRF